MTNASEQPRNHQFDGLTALATEWGSEPSDISYPSPEDLLQLNSVSTQGDDDSLEILVDDMAADFLEANSREYKKNIQIVRASAGSKAEKLAARDRQRSLFALSREALMRAAGINESLVIDKDQQSRDKIREILHSSNDQDGNPINPLRALGFIAKDEKGEDRFCFPYELMPDTTSAKWNAYIDAVKFHIKTQNSLTLGIANQSDLILADQHRKTAHDSVTMDLMGLLDVSDFDEMRRTVAKMRDGNFPNAATGEEDRVNRKLRQGIPVHKALREHLFPEGEYLPDPDLKFHR